MDGPKPAWLFYVPPPVRPQGLEVHTDITSAKVASLRAQPRAELHVWDSEKRLQTRARCTVTMTCGVAAAEDLGKMCPIRGGRVTA